MGKIVQSISWVKRTLSRWEAKLIFNLRGSRKQLTLAFKDPLNLIHLNLKHAKVYICLILQPFTQHTKSSGKHMDPKTLDTHPQKDMLKPYFISISSTSGLPDGVKGPTSQETGLVWTTWSTNSSVSSRALVTFSRL